MLMTLRNAVKFLTVVCLLFNVTVAHATVLLFINFQGLLTDSAGVPITTPSNTPLNGTFSIYNGQAITAKDLATVNLLYSKSQQVTVTNGLFNVMIGKGTCLLTVMRLAGDRQFYSVDQI